MNKEGLLIVISGPSGTGKGTIVKEILKRDANLKASVSATTRAPRNGEVHGEHYNFISKDLFSNLIETDGLLEYAEYCGNFYGTPRRYVEDMRRSGHDVILEIEVQGAEKIRENVPDAVNIFIVPPSMNELYVRLKGRATEDEATVVRRMVKAATEINQAEKYDYVVVNDIIESCTDTVMSIINAERHKSDKMKETIKEVLNNV